MSSSVISVCLLGLGAVVLLALARVVRGPTVLDRILAFDLIATAMVAMIAVLSVQWHTPLFLELVLLYSLLGFVGTVVFTFYLHRTLPRRRSGRERSGAAEVPQEPLS
jgi:multicomponent Na+:H+ antiporter subunit F